MHKPIMIVGEYWGEAEENSGRPFDGPSGALLYGLLRQAGIDKNDCYFTNAINARPAGNRFESFCGPRSEAVMGYRAFAPGKFIHQRYTPELERLHEEIERVKPNVIVAAGNLAMWAVCKKIGIKKHRGSPMPSHPKGYKVIPTWTPNSIMRQWELRVVVLSDLTKARAESAYPEIRRPSHLIHLEPSIDDIKNFYHEFLHPSKTPYVSCDIETKMDTITEVGYGNASGSHIIVIPFYDRGKKHGNYWETFEEEREAWRLVRHINAVCPTIGQNFAYDMQYFWRTVRIPTPKFHGDTMLLQHSLQPELEKSLGFLASVYTNEPSWKFMRTDHSTLKKGDD